MIILFFVYNKSIIKSFRNYSIHKRALFLHSFQHKLQKPFPGLCKLTPELQKPFPKS